MDTIQPTQNIVHVIEDGIIKTDGTTILGGDDRAGVAVILEILEVLKENSIPHPPIEVILFVCEEAGMYGAKHLDASEIKSEFGFVFDCQASPGAYIIEAPGAVSFKIIVEGKAAHAAVSPDKGINAIQIASRAIAKLKLGRWDNTGMMNIGTIHGGVSINVIPDIVEVTGETRNPDKEKLEYQINLVKEAFEEAAKYYGGEVDIKLNVKYGGYHFKGEEPVIEAARKGITAAGLEPKPISYPGGSDANVLNNKGMTALNLGVGFKNAHSKNEQIAISDLVTTAKIGLNIIIEAVNSSNTETRTK